MKKINLISRLLSYSHEKQSPQRFARYAVMLIMLLTLGVGQMWGYNEYNKKYLYFNGSNFTSFFSDGTKPYISPKWDYDCNNSSSNGGDKKMNQIGTSYAYYLDLSNSSASYKSFRGFYIGRSSSFYNGAKMGYVDGSDKNCIWANNSWGSYTWGYYAPPMSSCTLSDNGTTKTWGGDGSSGSPYLIPTSGTIKLSASATSSISDSEMTKKYQFKDDGTSKQNGTSSTCNYTASSTTGTTHTMTVEAYNYYVEVSGDHKASSAIYYQTRTPYNMSYAKGSPSASISGSKSTEIKLKSVNYTLPNSAVFTRTGYTQTGWATSDGGNKAYNLGGSYTTDAAQTFYPFWTAKTTTVTLTKNAPGGETVSGASSVTATYDAALPSFTALSCTGGYALTGYWTETSGGTKVINADGSFAANSGIWNRTDGATLELFAQWSLDRTLTYDGNTNTGGDVPAAATTYSNGASVTVLGNVAASPLVKTGYTFTGWNTAVDGNGTPYAAGSTITMNANYTLYAQWSENLTTVTVGVNPSGSGTLTVDAAAFTPGNTTTAGVTTSHTVVATKQPGYKFSSWGTSGNTAGTSSTNTYTLKGNGNGSTGTLTANFSRLYAYIQGRFQVKDAARSTTTTTYSSGGQWNESSTNIQMEYDNTNHRFELHTHMTPSELTANHGTGCQDCNPYFFIKTSTSNSSLAGVTTYKCTSSGATLVSTGSANGAAVSSSGANSLRFNSTTTTSYAVVYFDESKIWYELEQRLQYDANGGSGTAPTGDNGHNSYHAKDANATAEANTFTARKNYTFAGWNTAADITGNNYAVGANVPMSADRILYAKWNRSVTLDQQDATTPGSTSVTATWNCSTLPTINNPEKTGYDFGGWYTETAGNGNIIINTSGQLQASKTNWTVSGGKFQRTPSSDASESKPLYAMWTQTVTLNANLANHGSGANTTATIVYKATDKSSITHCTPATGYHLEGYYTAATGGTKILAANGDFAGSDITVDAVPYISGGAWVKAGETTLYAHYEPNTYDVILDVNGATSGSNQTVTATFDAAMPTVCSDGTTPLAAPSKTGYTFGGYWTNTTGTGTQYYTNELASNHIWDVATNNTHIYAKWTANPYTVTLDVDEDNKGTIADADESASVTFDAAPTTIANRPTAANGYALDGYYTDHLGEGTKLINGDGTWIASVLGYTDGSKNWIYAGNVTLYAYYKKAEITELVASPGVIAPGETITVTPTISPTPTGTTKVCYELQYSNGTPLPSQPTFTPGEGNAVSFTVPSASATYKIEAKLYTGSTCGSGTLLSTRSTTFQVAGEHTVTIRYQDSEGRTLQASASIEARPLDWTTVGAITPPTITGYTFARWDAGDGVTIKNGDSDPVTTTTTSSIQIKAVYDGTLTAVYAKKRLIFFNNTLGWSSVYVYFYKNDSYWESTGENRGSGANGLNQFTDYPFSENYWGEMTQIEGTNIYYFDAEKKGVNASYDDVVFTKDNQYGYNYFNNTKAVRRGDYNSTQLPMFVPIEQTPATHNSTKYYNSGYWMNYPENTGYSLLIYNQKAKDGAVKLYEYPFEFTEDFTMPMELVVDLEAGQTYGFEIKRTDGTYYSNTGTMTANTTNWSMSKDQSSYCGLQTTAAGNYTFRLYYSSSSYRMDVTYPVAVNDYRIVYTDLATWSKDAHTANWNHPSRVITKNSSATETKKDTVSFFWTYGSSPAIAYQTCSAVAAGSASWSAGTSISVSSYSSVLTKKGIYNFIFEQPAGGASISLVGVEPYTGNFYIRTDCAGSTKWSNFQSTDHQMTYSDYAEANSGYTHYYTHWVTTGQNVKFCIANDYSPCITDTLVEDKGTVIADITTEGNANAGRLNSGNASIRFMWDQAINKISRAYISGSSTISDRFLVLEGDAKMFDASGNPLSISGLNANEINLVDDQNFVYEREIKVQTGAKAKLTAKYNSNIQYFKGGSGTTSEDSVELLGGAASATKHTMRIVYDFKTNRLMTAFVPTDTIKNAMAINADLMIVREHQEAGQQLIFNGGSLSKVHTVYGVMRFNRWTLNNKEKTGSHDPVGDPKSSYERGLYWISFPFDVNLSDVFGFGTYGTHWIIMEYDGAERAQKGYWADSKGFWKYVTNRNGKVLEAGKGYVLALDLDLMKSDNTSFWTHNIEQVELFFPSASYVSNITATDVKTTADRHLYDAAAHPGHTDDRTYKDSHWNMIGVPSYANYGETLTSDGEEAVITWSTPTTADLPYLYEWNAVDNTYTVQTGSTYPFKSMHAYMVQYHGDMYWHLASATPPASPAPLRYEGALNPVEFRLELQQNEKMVDQTFVKMSNEENVSAGFAFDEDLSKEFNANKANIYTIVENNMPIAGNVQPMSEQTTVVPVGVKIATNGEYTFAMPDGTEGIGITLVDNETGIRTSLSALDYTVNLNAGTYNERFVLEISPIHHMPTGIEEVSGERLEVSGVRKLMIDGILYIVKDGKMFDARGARVQ